MKTILLAAAIAATATLFPTAPKQACAANPAAGEFDVAISGCCKKFNGSRWVPVGQNFKKCISDNASTDGDEIFAKNGKYWWDTRC